MPERIPGGWELVLLLVVAVALFGSKRLPEAARSLGQSLRILKAETKGLREDETPSGPPPAPIVAAPTAALASQPDAALQVPAE